MARTKGECVCVCVCVCVCLCVCAPVHTSRLWFVFLSSVFFFFSLLMCLPAIPGVWFLTSDFVKWEVSGEGLPNDALFTSQDCNAWNISWAKVLITCVCVLVE